MHAKYIVLSYVSEFMLQPRHLKLCDSFSQRACRIVVQLRRQIYSGRESFKDKAKRIKKKKWGMLRNSVMKEEEIK